MGASTGSARSAEHKRRYAPVPCFTVQAAFDQMVPCDLFGHTEQEQHLGALAQAPFGRVLPHRLTDQA